VRIVVAPDTSVMTSRQRRRFRKLLKERRTRRKSILTLSAAKELRATTGEAATLDVSRTFSASDA
jgi:hypothetical protein